MIRLGVDPLRQVFEPDFADGDVATRRSIECSHGRLGYCADDAVEGERKAVDALYEHAFAYAVKGLGPDVAERYAAWTLADSWRPGALFVRGSHAVDLPRFLAEEAASA